MAMYREPYEKAKAKLVSISYFLKLFRTTQDGLYDLMDAGGRHRGALDVEQAIGYVQRQ